MTNGDKAHISIPNDKSCIVLTKNDTESFQGILSQAKLKNKSAHNEVTRLNIFELEKLDNNLKQDLLTIT